MADTRKLTETYFLKGNSTLVSVTRSGSIPTTSRSTSIDGPGWWPERLRAWPVRKTRRSAFCGGMCRETQAWQALSVGSMDEIVREFLVESYENLDQLDQDLVGLEGKPGSRELLSRVFRTIHTIKGTCGFLGFSRLESLTHAGEGLLSELRDARRAMNQPRTDVLLAMVDTVREILASIESTGAEGDIVDDHVIELIREVLEQPATQTARDVDHPAGGGGRSRTMPGQPPRPNPRSESTSMCWIRSCARLGRGRACRRPWRWSARPGSR